MPVRPRKHVLFWGALGVAGLLLSAAVVLALITASSRPSTDGFTYTARWTLPELVAHADAGEVVGVTAPPSTGSGEALLVARLRSGQLVAVEPGISPADAVAALRALGYGRLLTAEAASLAGATGAAPGGSAPPSLPFILTIAAVLLAGTAVLGRVGGPRGWRERRRFRPVARAGSPVGRRPFGRRAGDRDAPDPELSAVRLADVAGVDEAKLELVETIEFLRDPARFAAVGARPVRGVLLYGPPGTGKTLLARAVAAEAGVPFFASSGADFVEKYVGVGASRMRALFGAARAAGRAVIFVDEIDAIAKRRGGQNSHEEWEGTLNALLVEMDGFGPNEDIVVLAATNRLDVLDPAILRPGRFTRTVHVPLPDRDDRAAILRVHAAGKPLAAGVDLAAVARKTYGFSGAQLANLLNEAAILAARDNRVEITPADTQAGWLKVAVGTSRVRSMDDRERSIIAAHEAGHAVAGILTGEHRRVEEISLYQHGEALGVTVSSSVDNDLPSETDLRAQLVALMGGRVAEELLFREVTGGASSDFEKATDIAQAMVGKLGMGRDPQDSTTGATGRGILSALVATDRARPSREVEAAQDRAARGILDAAYRQARALLLARMDLLQRVAGYLYEHERMNGDELEAVVAGTLGPVDPIGWRASGASPRPWDEIAGLFTRPEEALAAAPTGASAKQAGGRRRRTVRNLVVRALPRWAHPRTRRIASSAASREDAVGGRPGGGA